MHYSKVEMVVNTRNYEIFLHNSLYLEAIFSGWNSFTFSFPAAIKV